MPYAPEGATGIKRESRSRRCDETSHTYLPVSKSNCTLLAMGPEPDLKLSCSLRPQKCKVLGRNSTSRPFKGNYVYEGKGV
jgi:hypothetical protein